MMESGNPRHYEIDNLLREVKAASRVWASWITRQGWAGKTWGEVTQEELDEAISWLKRVKANPLLQLVEEE